MFYWTATSAPKWPTSDSHKRWQQQQSIVYFLWKSSTKHWQWLEISNCRTTWSLTQKNEPWRFCGVRPRRSRKRFPVFFCLGVELLNCLALCDMILLTFDKHRSSATSLMLGALEWQCGKCWALRTSRTRVWARQRWTTQHGFTNCDRCGWAKQEWAWFCCDDGCQKADVWPVVTFCARWKRDWRRATTWWRRPPTTLDTTRRAGLQLIRSQLFSQLIFRRYGRAGMWIVNVYKLTILARMAIKADRWWLTVGLGSHELDLLFHT